MTTSWLLCVVSILTGPDAVCWPVPPHRSCEDYAHDWYQRLEAWENRSHLRPGGGGMCVVDRGEKKLDQP